VKQPFAKWWAEELKIEDSVGCKYPRKTGEQEAESPLSKFFRFVFPD